MNCVNIHRLDIDEKEFGNDFNPSRLDFARDKKEQTTQSVANMLKRITEISNCNLLKNADGILHSKPADTEIEWVGKNKSRIPQNKFKVTY